MAIQVSTNFNLGAALPLDARSVVATIAERDAIATKYAGMEVFVTATGKTYRYGYVGGWRDIDSGVYTVDLTGATDSNYADFAFSLGELGRGNTDAPIPRTFILTGTHTLSGAKNLIRLSGYDDNPETGSLFTFINISSGSIGISNTEVGTTAEFVISVGSAKVMRFNGAECELAADYSALTPVQLAKIDAIAEGATKVEKSSTNGNIKINGTETTVYTHPTTAGNKHIPTGGASGRILGYSASGTAAWIAPTKSTVGLGNVDNTADVDKPISTAQKEYIDSQLSAIDSMAFKGILNSASEVLAIVSANEWKGGWTWKLNFAASADDLEGLTNKSVEVGDVLYAVKDHPDSVLTPSAASSYFSILQSNIDGAVTSHETTVKIGKLPVFSSTTGRVIAAGKYTEDELIAEAVSQGIDPNAERKKMAPLILSGGNVTLTLDSPYLLVVENGDSVIVTLPPTSGNEGILPDGWEVKAVFRSGNAGSDGVTFYTADGARIDYIVASYANYDHYIRYSTDTTLGWTLTSVERNNTYDEVRLINSFDEADSSAENSGVGISSRLAYDNLIYTNSDPMPSTIGGLAEGTTFSETALKDILNNLLYPYVKPVVSLTATASGAGTYELGTSVTPTFTVAVTKKSKPITTLSLYNGSTALASNLTVQASGGTQTSIKPTAALTATATITARAGDGTGTTTSNGLTYTFVNPFYHGVVSSAPTASAGVKALTKLIQSKGAKTVTHTTTASASRYCFCYPASYGDLKTIKDANGFDNTADFTKTTVSVTNAGGTAVSYNVYTYNNAVSPGTMTMTYSFT